jgi:hypothetical protein
MQELIRKWDGDFRGFIVEERRRFRHYSLRELENLRAFQNMFERSERDWVAVYLFMREKFDVLDSLGDSFSLDENRHKAFKQVVGTYQSTEYHLEALKEIHHYFHTAAEQGNPIAQFHLALFLNYLGDLIDIDKEEIAAYQKWLDKAGDTDLARARVVEVKAQLVAEEARAPQRKIATARRLEALLQVENDKLDMIENIVVRAVQSVPPSAED